MSFRSARSRLKIDKVGGLGRPRGECAQIWGRVGGQGGGHRRLLESDRNWQESDNAFRTPCTPRGAADLMGSALPADLTNTTIINFNYLSYS